MLTFACCASFLKGALLVSPARRRRGAATARSAGSDAVHYWGAPCVPPWPQVVCAWRSPLALAPLVSGCFPLSPMFAPNVLLYKRCTPQRNNDCKVKYYAFQDQALACRRAHKTRSKTHCEHFNSRVSPAAPHTATLSIRDRNRAVKLPSLICVLTRIDPACCVLRVGAKRD